MQVVCCIVCWVHTSLAEHLCTVPESNAKLQLKQGANTKLYLPLVLIAVPE